MNRISLFIMFMVIPLTFLFGGSGSEKQLTVKVSTAEELQAAIIKAANDTKRGTTILIESEMIGNFEIPSTYHTLKLIGKGARPILNGIGLGTVLFVSHGADVVLKNLEIVSGNIPENPTSSIFDQGFGIFNEGNLKIKSCLVTNCNPAGILNEGGNVSVEKSLIERNSGAALINFIGIVDISKCTLSNNNTLFQGGTYYGVGAAVLMAGGIQTICDSQIENNYGIGITIEYGILNLNHSTIKGNTDSGLISYEGTVTFNDSIISENQSTGLYNYGFLTINRCRIENNISPFDGAGVNNKGFMTINESILLDNTAQGNGGGIFNDQISYDVIGVSKLLINNSTIQGNISLGSGGGVYNLGSLNVYQTKVKSNLATNDGGGFANITPGILTLNQSCVNKNTARVTGGGIYSPDGNLTLIRADVSGNSPDQVSPY